MFDNYDNNIVMLEGAYKKLKAYYYYDKSLLYIKKKIAYFEYQPDAVSHTFLKLANCLKDNDEAYFESLINQIGFIVLPKKLKSHAEENNVMHGNVDHTKNVSKINFYIDAPIELLILDSLWMLLLGKIQSDNKCRSHYSYAGKFKKTLFVGNTKDLFGGIDFESNRCFEPYFNNYTQWRDRAFNSIRDKQSSADLLMMSLDLKSFYYLVNFDFENIASIFNNDARLPELERLTNIMKKVYYKYTLIIRKQKKGIPNTNGVVFPIGLLSPIVLRESYLNDFDNDLIGKINPVYYGRYVDDILIVTQANQMSAFSQKDFIDYFLVSKSIAIPMGKDNYKLVSHPNLKLQSEKINCFFFKLGTPNILLEIYEDKIRGNSSEANLLPDVDILNHSFGNQAYALSGVSGINKIRDLRFLQSDNYSATRLVNGLKRLLKVTSIDLFQISPFLDEIMEFYRDSQGVEYSNSWRSVFELFTLCGDKKRANKFYLNIKRYIKSLDFSLLETDEIYANSSKKLLRQLQRDMCNALDIAMSSAVALDFGMGRARLLKDAKAFRISNLMNHQLVSLPLLNYISDQLQYSQSLIALTVGQTIGDINKMAHFSLDEFLLKWSPRFIHLEELYFFVFVFNFNSQKQLYRNNHDWLFKKFLNINHLGPWAMPPVSCDVIKALEPSSANLLKMNVDRNLSLKTRIGLVSTPIKESDALLAICEPEKCLTFKKKEQLFRILNTAKQEHTQYLSFPEFYLPLIWLPEVWTFCNNNNITIISGLQYILAGNCAYNFTCLIEPTGCSRWYHNSLLLFREKLYYAPEEQKLLARQGFITADCKSPFYYVISEPKFEFSTILCFEFTDVCSRAALKGRIDALFVPQLNRDTHYFSSIVTTTSRDLHCFIVQTNTSIYGDSRITGPFKAELKNILQIKGGTNDIVIVGEIDVQRLRKRQIDYPNELTETIQKCLMCKKRLHSPNRNPCENCKVLPEKNSIKGTPPNFHRE
jgi:hypothetical protein